MIKAEVGAKCYIGKDILVNNQDEFIGISLFESETNHRHKNKTIKCVGLSIDFNREDSDEYIHLDLYKKEAIAFAKIIIALAQKL